MIADPTQPVSPRNPDVRWSVIGGPTERDLRHLATFHSEAEARAFMASNRSRYPELYVQECRHYQPVDDDTPWRRIPVIGEIDSASGAATFSDPAATPAGGGLH